MRLESVALDLLETVHIEAGSLTRQFEYLFRSTTESLGSSPQLFTGVQKLSSEDSWSNNGVVVVKTDRGYPATIRAVIAGLEGEP